MDPRTWLFDKRVQRRNLENGVISVREFEEYLRSLEECEYEPIAVAQEREKTGETRGASGDKAGKP